ncbi:hypothetical protein THAOC_24207, partial [Thalassiosira oceanica]
MTPGPAPAVDVETAPGGGSVRAAGRPPGPTTGPGAGGAARGGAGPAKGIVRDSWSPYTGTPECDPEEISAVTRHPTPDPPRQCDRAPGASVQTSFPFVEGPFSPQHTASVWIGPRADDAEGGEGQTSHAFASQWAEGEIEGQTSHAITRAERRDPRTTPSRMGKTRRKCNESYLELEAFRNERGNCNVPKSRGQLGRWVHNQRQNRKNDNLSEECIHKLDGLGFNWGTTRGPQGPPRPWDERLEEL